MGSDYFESRLSKVFAFWFMVAFSGCEPPATFEKPQPLNSKNLEEFPAKITGAYQKPNSAMRLVLSRNSLIRSLDTVEKFAIHQLDSTYILEGNLLTNNLTGEAITVQISGDSIVSHIHAVDTLFDLTTGDVLKKLQGHYFLNSRWDKNTWEVTSLVWQKDQLRLKTIASEKDVAVLRQLTNTPSGSATVFNLTKKQFRKFINADGFSHEEDYFRVKE